jgi:CheY-like chemotaxis protein
MTRIDPACRPRHSRASIQNSSLALPIHTLLQPWPRSASVRDVYGIGGGYRKRSIAAGGPENVKRSMAKTRILIADDHEVVRCAVRSMLEGRSQFEVVGEASTGEEVIRRSMELEPDLIIMDIGLPGVNGLTAADMIKKMRPSTKIVAFSMYNSNGMENRAKELGLNAFVTKSEGSAALLSVIEALQNQKSFFPDQDSRERAPH